jgi:hypothetical protein
MVDHAIITFNRLHWSIVCGPRNSKYVQLKKFLLGVLGNLSIFLVKPPFFLFEKFRVWSGYSAVASIAAVTYERFVVC